MGYLADTKEIILALKKVYKEKKLSIDKVLAMVDAQEGEGKVSRSTIQRLFAPGSEDEATTFRYETTLIPVCNVLLDETSANTTIMMRYKRDLIEEFAAQNKELKEELKVVKDRERLKYHEELKKETRKFEESLEFISHQIALKDKRIDQLLDANIKLLNQLLTCPCRQSGSIHGDGK